MLLKSSTLRSTLRLPSYAFSYPPRAARMSTAAELNALIKTQGDAVRKLKDDKAAPEDITKEVGALKDLKAKLAALTVGGEKKAAGGGSKKAVKFTLKTAKVRSLSLRASNYP
jgi:hypothetical protein